MKYVAHPAVYRMRNKRLAFVQRAARYEGINDKGKRVACVVMEGCELDNDRLLMWSEDGRRVPTLPRNCESPEDLVRRVRAKE